MRDEIAIVDYGAGNLSSVKKALDFIGAKSVITSDPARISGAGRIVLPGVGSFGDAMKSLERLRLVAPLRRAIESGKPFLGICLGMQLLFEKSEESPGTEGLSILKGEVVKFRKGKVPQIGWNSLEIRKGKILGNGGFAYFVNSYYVKPEDMAIAASTTTYEDTKFASAVQKNNIFAVQFHPEKSGAYGLEILRRWLEC